MTPFDAEAQAPADMRKSAWMAVKDWWRALGAPDTRGQSYSLAYGLAEYTLRNDPHWTDQDTRRIDLAMHLARTANEWRDTHPPEIDR